MATKKNANYTQMAQDVTDVFFRGSGTAEDQAQAEKISPVRDRQEGAQAAQEGHQEDQPGKSSSVETKAVRGRKKGTGEPVKAVFSFRAAKGDVDQWRLYAAIKGDKVEDIGAAAMREYVKRHPLKDEEKALFDKRIEIMKARKNEIKKT
jgi:hypothetical protein